jgi:probable HAF family extracellular repeat protein
VEAIGPSGYASSATAISGTGAVVGNYQLPDGTFRAFLWQNGQSTTLALPAGAAQTWATAVSGTGQAGGYTDSGQNSFGLVWDNLGTPASTAGAYIMGLNSAGDAAGMAVATDGSGYAFQTHNGVLTSLGQPGGGDWSSANAINDAGQVAGTAMTAGGAFRAFSSSTLLGTLGGQSSYGNAINSAGTVAGSAQTASGALQAAYWNGANAIGLGTLGGANSYGYAIDAAGNVAGYSDLAGGLGTAAFLYQDGVLYDLNGLLGPGSSWQLLAAYGMNENGQIVGRGLYGGVEQAFLLTPERQILSASAPLTDSGVPEPATSWLIGVPILLYIALRSR